jgi:hypothetical protein
MDEGTGHDHLAPGQAGVGERPRRERQPGAGVDPDGELPDTPPDTPPDIEDDDEIVPL